MVCGGVEGDEGCKGACLYWEFKSYVGVGMYIWGCKLACIGVLYSAIRKDEEEDGEKTARRKKRKETEELI